METLPNRASDAGPELKLPNLSNQKRGMSEDYEENYSCGDCGLMACLCHDEPGEDDICEYDEEND